MEIDYSLWTKDQVENRREFLKEYIAKCPIRFKKLIEQAEVELAELNRKCPIIN